MEDMLSKTKISTPENHNQMAEMKKKNNKVIKKERKLQEQEANTATAIEARASEGFHRKAS